MHGDVESSHGGAHPPREAPKILLPCRNEASSQPLATSCEGDPSASRMETGRSAHLVSHWFATRPRLIVWDFDRTILRTHAFGEGVEVAQVAHRWQSDMCDAALFRAFVETAQAQGVDIGIASYGRRDVIHEYMRHVFAGAETAPFGVETNIITPQLLGEPGRLQSAVALCTPNDGGGDRGDWGGGSYGGSDNSGGGRGVGGSSGGRSHPPAGVHYYLIRIAACESMMPLPDWPQAKSPGCSSSAASVRSQRWISLALPPPLTARPCQPYAWQQHTLVAPHPHKTQACHLSLAVFSVMQSGRA